VKRAFELHRDYIIHEVLATHVHFDCAEGTEWDLNGEPTTIALSLSVTG
jgi:isoleucyl-tRNA synthetase